MMQITDGFGDVAKFTGTINENNEPVEGVAFYNFTTYVGFYEDVYNGTWENSLPDRYGRLDYPDNKGFYQGGFKEGQPFGDGIRKFKGKTYKLQHVK